MEHYYTIYDEPLRSPPFQVSPAMYVETVEDNPGVIVWLEDWENLHTREDAIDYAMHNDMHLNTVLLRTKYQIHRSNPTPWLGVQPTLINDNKYIAIEHNGSIMAYYWDKPNIESAVDKVLAKLGNTDAYTYNEAVEAFNNACIPVPNPPLKTKRLFPPHSLCVVLPRPPTKKQTYIYDSYLPVKCYYISAPTFVDSRYNNGYDLQFEIDNEKTEKCNQLVEYTKLRDSGAVGRTGHVTFRAKDNPPKTLHTLQLPCSIHFKKVSVKEVVSTCGDRVTTTLTVCSQLATSYLTDLAKDQKRIAFKEELVQAVFHPTRVARLVGDNWGTDESWLNQV